MCMIYHLRNNKLNNAGLSPMESLHFYMTMQILLCSVSRNMQPVQYTPRVLMYRLNYWAILCWINYVAEDAPQ